MSEAKRYEAMLEAALKHRAMGGREDRWRRYANWMRHRVLAAPPSGEQPVVNILQARARALVPQLALGIPSVRVGYDGMHPSEIGTWDENGVEAWARYLETVWRRNGMDVTMRRVTLDAIVFGIGIAFIGYEAPFVGGGVMPAGDKRSETSDGRSYGETVGAPPGRLFMARVSPFDFCLDPTAAHPTEARYMARRLLLTKAEADAIAPGAFRADSVGNVLERETDASAGRESRPADLLAAVPDEVRRVEVWELWDAETRTTVYLDADRKVPRDSCVRPWRSPSAAMPFALLLWDEVPDTVWPEGLAAGIEPLNNELNLVRRRQMQALRNGIRKYAVRGTLPPAARQALRSDVDGEVVELDPDADVTPLQFQPIPPDMYLVENRVKSDIDEISMTSHMMAQGTATIRKTATETAFIQAAADAMMGYRQMLVERCAEHALRIVMETAMELDDEVTLVRVRNAVDGAQDALTGEPKRRGDEMWYAFVPVEHKGRYQVTVEPGSMVAQAKDVERQHLLAVRDRLKDEPYFDKREFDRLILSGLPSVKDASRYIMQDEGPGPQDGRQVPGDEMLAMLMGGMGAPQMPGAAPEVGGPQAEELERPEYGEVNPVAEADVLSAMLGGMSPGAGTGGV